MFFEELEARLRAWRSSQNPTKETVEQQSGESADNSQEGEPDEQTDEFWRWPSLQEQGLWLAGSIARQAEELGLIAKHDQFDWQYHMDFDSHIAEANARLEGSDHEVMGSPDVVGSPVQSQDAAHQGAEGQTSAPEGYRGEAGAAGEAGAGPGVGSDFGGSFGGDFGGSPSF